ncbi:MAG TPA: hypothetical protein VKH64_14815 [Candidatus Binatia bacterium]|nr:hypothetical protein [Candidatus Binatia bacterium]
MAVRIFFAVLFLFAVAACKDAPKEDKAKEAVRDAITSDFRLYQGAKDKIGESQKRDAERREQEKQLE